jgi:hypothetical protein
MRNSGKFNRPKNQHWVPRFYLRQFATPETRERDEAQIWMFSNQDRDGDERLTNIKNVCARRYLYSPVDDSGQRDWALEEQLADLEAHLASLWPVFAAELIDFGQSSIRNVVGLFVSVMHMRSPDTLYTVEDIHRRLVALYETAPKNPDRTPNVEIVDRSGTAQPLDPRGWDKYRTAGADDHQRFFVQTIRGEAVRIARRLIQKRWCTLLVEEDAFVTSDRPVSIQHQSKEVFGVGTPGSIVIFPLTPRRLLVMDDRHEQPPNQYYSLSRESVGPLNGLIWRNGRLLLTGRPIRDVLIELVLSTHEVCGSTNRL